MRLQKLVQREDGRENGWDRHLHTFSTLAYTRELGAGVRQDGDRESEDGVWTGWRDKDLHGDMDVEAQAKVPVRGVGRRSYGLGGSYVV